MAFRVVYLNFFNFLLDKFFFNKNEAKTKIPS
jgi:hypothetical protein